MFNPWDGCHDEYHVVRISLIHAITIVAEILPHHPSGLRGKTLLRFATPMSLRSEVSPLRAPTVHPAQILLEADYNCEITISSWVAYLRTIPVCLSLSRHEHDI